jgi:two-component system sensor histidine kinase KdpD
VGLTRAEWREVLRRAFQPVSGEWPEGERSARVAVEGFPRRVYLLAVRTVRPSSEASWTLETLRDITAEVRLEEERARREAGHAREMAELEARLEQIERLKLELTANVTHDLRTPLASIKAAVSGLLAGDVRYTDEETRETLQVIEEETDRLQRRVQNMLQMARSESGSLPLSRDWVDVADVVASALEALRPLRGQRPVLVHIPDELPLIYADYDQVQIALRNLLENAFLYTPAETPVEVTANSSWEQVRIRVLDHGPGIMPDEAEAIFGKFYRGRAARRIPGTGLGLPICRAIAEAHGGRLWAEHLPGGGVAFVLSLPAEQSPAPEAEPPSLDLPAGQEPDPQEPGVESVTPAPRSPRAISVDRVTTPEEVI